MLERTKLLFQQKGDDYSVRTRDIVLNDDISKFQYLRVFVGYGNDGMQVNDIPVFQELYPKSAWNYMWTYWVGGGTPGVIGSMRINGWKKDANTNTYKINITRLTYLNNGTTAYSESTNNTWGQPVIWKIIGVYRDDVLR